MTLHIPICMNILRVVLLVTADLDLLEAPLRQNRIGRTKVTPKQPMTEPQPCRKRMDAVHMRAFDIIYDLDLPIIPCVSNTRVAIAGYFVVEFRDGRENGVRVEVPRGWRVLESDDVPVLEVPQLLIRVVLRLIPTGEDNPVVVVVFVVIAGDLLLVGADRVGLYVRMQQSTTPAHVLECDLGAVGDLWNFTRKKSTTVAEKERTERISREIIPDQVGLEKRAHLSVTRTGVIENHEVYFE